MLNDFNFDMASWVYDRVQGEHRPATDSFEKNEAWQIPEIVSSDFNKLKSIITSKYPREFLKVCAFYNKMFPSLKTSNYVRTAYNAPPFTAAEQERSDTGYGTNYNYLKQIIDQLTSRLGTISFVPKLLAEEQNFEYVLYKDEAERVLRKFIKDDDLYRVSIEAFHNAAILGYSHVFIDPFTGRLIKANDYELGVFESQFNARNIKQMLYRCYDFPVISVYDYISDLDEEASTELLESLTGRDSVDFSMYFDCIKHEVYVTIANKTLPAKEYPFDNVLMTSFVWDTSFSRQLTSSMFDLLYPIQREINRIAAKKQQIIRMYKGAVPVFNSDVDIALKAISNGAGEALYIDSSRSTAELMTVINPTPLDPQLDAEIQSHKTAMYELAGIQNASFDMQNMKSAAAVIALDQTRDSVFQAQMSGMSQFIKSMLMLYITYMSKPTYSDKLYSNRAYNVDWDMLNKLLDNSYISMQPVHLNDPLSDEANQPDNNLDYLKLASTKVVLNIVEGKYTFDTLPYFLDVNEVLIDVAGIFIKFEALGIDVPESLHLFLMHAYLALIKDGTLTL